MKNYKGYNEEKEVMSSNKHKRDLKKSLLLLSCGIAFIATAYGIYGNNYKEVSSSSDFSEVVDFDSSSVEYKYSYDKIEMDFDKANFVKGVDRLFVKEDALWIHYPVGSSGINNSGAMINTKLKGSKEYMLEYEIYFDGCDKGFNWQDGGVLCGLAGGEFYEGNETKADKNGFHAKLAYNNYGYLYPVVYTANDAKVGSDIYPTLGAVQQNTWNKIKMYIKVNDIAESNGVFRVWINDNLCFNNESIRYVTDDSLINVNNLCVYNNDTINNLDNEQFVYIDNYSITNKLEEK